MTEDRDCVRTACKFISYNSDRKQQPNISDTSWCRGAFSIFTVPAVHSRTKNTFFISMQQRISEDGANLLVENCEMWWNVVHRVLQIVVFQTANCTAVDFSDGYNHGRKKILSVYCKSSTYSAPTQCIHFNPSLLGDFTVLKAASLVITIRNMYIW